MRHSSVLRSSQRLASFIFACFCQGLAGLAPPRRGLFIRGLLIGIEKILDDKKGASFTAFSRGRHLVRKILIDAPSEEFDPPLRLCGATSGQVESSSLETCSVV